MNYDELVKELRSGCGLPILQDKMNRAADAIEELQMPRWISVKERLPDGEVLALNNLQGSYGYQEYLIGYVGEDYQSDSGYLCENDDAILTNVTHWMPLPKPPKEDEA